MQDVLVDSRGDLHCPYCQGTHFDIAARPEDGKLDGAVSVGVGLILQMKCLACGEWSKGGDAQLMPPDEATSTNGHPGRQDAGLEWAKREAARNEAEREPMRRPEPSARRRVAWAAAVQQERARLQGLASRLPDHCAGDEGARWRREGVLSREERREYWKRMDAELEERQRRARARRGGL